MSKKILTGFILVILLEFTYSAAALSPEEDSPLQRASDFSKKPSYNNRFLSALRRSVEHLSTVQYQHPLKLIAANHALKKTAQAAEKVLDFENTLNISETLDLLNQAQRDYPENSFIVLLQAIFYDRTQKTGLAEEKFQEYLIKSNKPNPFDDAFVRNIDYHELRRGVVEILKSRGKEAYDPAGTRGGLFKKWAAFLLRPSRENWDWNLALITALFGGALLLLTSKILGADFGRAPFRDFVWLYVLIGITYLIWLGDKWFGLPFGWDRHTALSFFTIGSVTALISGEILHFLWNLYGPLPKGYRHCQHCRTPVSKVLLECPSCRGALPS